MSKNKRSEQILDDCQSSKRQKTGVNLEKDGSFLSDVAAFILKAGIEKLRMQIFENQLKKFGGVFETEFSSNVTHLVVDDKMDCERMCRIMKLDSPPTNVDIVKSGWLSACFKDKKLVDTLLYKLDCSVFSNSTKVNTDMSNKLNKPGVSSVLGETSNTSASVNDLISNTKSNLPRVGFMFGHKSKPVVDNDDDSDFCASDGEGPANALSDSEEEAAKNTSPKKDLPIGNWVCAQSSKNPVLNQNKLITDKLEEMVRTYESTNDKWRAFGYQKAIQVLKKHPKPISSFEEAKNLPSIGKRLAEKIWEIAESGELRKLNEFKASEDIRVIEMFKDVWGAGAHTARAWYQQGLRTLEDLRTKANLTHQQKVGLRCYDDFLDRMPRSEAGEIEQVVREAAESLQDGVIAQACGSYRRGKPDCGDVDVLVTHPDGKSHKGLFAKLLAKLKQQGFLTDDLVTAEDNDSQKKYLGVCKLPGEGRRHRRLDIIVVPYDEYACALVYFTGSAHFNRSLRHLAKKMNMSLSEHSLNVGVVRHGSEKIYEGTPVSTPTEESVFTKLGVPYRPPEERDH